MFKWIIEGIGKDVIGGIAAIALLKALFTFLMSFAGKIPDITSDIAAAATNARNKKNKKLTEAEWQVISEEKKKKEEAEAKAEAEKKKREERDEKAFELLAEMTKQVKADSERLDKMEKDREQDKLAKAVEKIINEKLS